MQYTGMLNEEDDVGWTLGIAEDSESDRSSDGPDSEVEVLLYSQLYHDTVSHSSPASNADSVQVTAELPSNNDIIKNVRKPHTGFHSQSLAKTRSLLPGGSEKGRKVINVLFLDDPTLGSEGAQKSQKSHPSRENRLEKNVGVSKLRDSSFDIVDPVSERKTSTPSQGKINSESVVSIKGNSSHLQRVENASQSSSHDIQEDSILILNVAKSDTRNKRQRTKCKKSETVKKKKKLDGAWEIDNRDLYKSEFRKTIDYRQATALVNVMCLNCRERGHKAAHCMRPMRLITCFLCGQDGHMANLCPEMPCERCHAIGHSAASCVCQKSMLCAHCSLCSGRGHYEPECPDLWRRYHLTTVPGPVIYGNSFRNPRVFCYNCAQRGHYGHECVERKMVQNVTPVTPFIMSYMEPTAPLYLQLPTLKMKLKAGKTWQRRQFRLADIKWRCIQQGNWQYHSMLTRIPSNPVLQAINDFTQGANIWFPGFGEGTLPPWGDCETEHLPIAPRVTVPANATQDQKLSRKQKRQRNKANKAARKARIRKKLMGAGVRWTNPVCLSK